MCRGIHSSKNEQRIAMQLNDTNKCTHNPEVGVIRKEEKVSHIMTKT